MRNLPSSPAERELQLRLATARSKSKDIGSSPAHWPVYIEVVVGGVAWCTKKKMIDHLKHRGLIKETDASQIEEVIRCSRFEITKIRQDLKLALATPKEVGLSQGGFLEDIYRKAKGFDLALLPIDTGPQTILQAHSYWTKHSSIVVATEPVILKDGRKFVFDLSNLRLRVLTGEPGHYYGPTQPFLFRRL
jgi:hypothetical protein